MFRRKIRLRDQSNTVEISYLSGADVRDDKVSELLVWLFSLNSVATLLLGFFFAKSSKIKVFMYGSFAGHQWNLGR